MNLELKHIAPYLPYELSGYISFLPDTTFILNGIVKDFVKCYTKEGNNTPVSCIIKKFKPRLRKKEYLLRLKNEIAIRWGGGLSEKEATDEMINTAYIALRYDFIEFMLENHIDIFGLIDAGLAFEIE